MMERRNFLKGALACLAAPVAAAVKATTPSPAKDFEALNNPWYMDRGPLVMDGWGYDIETLHMNEPSKPNLNGDILPYECLPCYDGVQFPCKLEDTQPFEFEHIHGDGIVVQCEMPDMNTHWNTFDFLPV
jgi:hypothetical protein